MTIEYIQKNFNWAMTKLNCKAYSDGFSNIHMLMVRSQYHKRAYHNLNHITDILKKYDACVASGYTMRNPHMVLCAIYHDFHTNEKQSANWISGAFPLNLSADDITIIKFLVESTAFNSTLFTMDHQLFHDLDYSILATHSKKELMSYERGIRDEWKHVKIDKYNAKRLSFLYQLTWEDIFKTSYAKNLGWEEQAKVNIEYLTTYLSKGE